MKRQSNMFIRTIGSSARRRGVSLIEAVLYLTVVSSVIVLMASVIDSESKRQENISTASTMNLMISSSQRYVAAEYDTIRDQLLAGARTNNRAEITISMQNLSDMGYLPAAFAVEDTNLFEQRYVLLMRAVSVDDVAVPQVTMTEVQIDGDSDTLIDNHLIDLDNSNDEMTIEAILVTSGGDEVPAHRGPPITVRTQKPTSGYVGEDGLARGPYGSFVFDISGFSGFADFPTEGHFANIISLSRFSNVDTGGFNSGGGVPDPLQRCAGILDIAGQTPSSTIYQTCLSNNQMSNDIVFNSYDSDADGTIDVFPGIRGVTDIDMAGAVDTDGDGIPDRFSEINNAFSINMGPALDTDSDGIPDVFPDITGLARLACENTAGTAIQGTMVFDCDNLVLDGNVLVTGDSTISGDQTADRFISEDLGGQDLSEGIYNALLLASGETIMKPTCPAVTADGNFQMEPRVFVVPAAYSHPGGLPTVGIRSYAEDFNAASWRVRLFNFVDEDRCTSSITNPMTTNTADYRTENAAQCTSADGLADVYEVSANAGRVLAMTRCY
jgi:hypothetical protein